MGKGKGVVFFAEEVDRRILEGERDFTGAAIEGALLLGGANINDDLSFERATIDGNVYLVGAVIKGNLNLERATIRGDIYLTAATIEDSLNLREATIEGDLDLEGVTIGGELILSTKQGPKMIFVNLEMAESVHFAAPTVPLVIRKKK
jgi:hypothetical protein